MYISPMRRLIFKQLIIVKLEVDCLLEFRHLADLWGPNYLL